MFNSEMEGEDQNQNEWGGVGGGVGGFIFRFNVWSFFILTRLVSSGELNPSDRYLILPWLIPCTSYRPRTRSSVISSPRERETEKGRKRQTVPSSQQRDKINCIKERNENETRRGLPPPLSHRQCALLCSALLWLFQLESKRTAVLSFLSFSSSFFFFFFLLLLRRFIDSCSVTNGDGELTTASNQPTDTPTHSAGVCDYSPAPCSKNESIFSQANKQKRGKGREKEETRVPF